MALKTAEPQREIKVIGKPFERGVSGNPGGRPKIENDVVALARENSVPALNKIVALTMCGNPKVELAACNSILDRAFGKASQALRIDANVTSFVARLPAVIEGAAQWMEQHKPNSSQLSSGKQTPALKSPT